MLATCARAVEIGLVSLAFTENVDLTPWTLHGNELSEHYRGHLGADGRFLAAIELQKASRCGLADLQHRAERQRECRIDLPMAPIDSRGVG